jgi:hypothetical protein
VLVLGQDADLSLLQDLHGMEFTDGVAQVRPDLMPEQA